MVQYGLAPNDIQDSQRAPYAPMDRRLCTSTPGDNEAEAMQAKVLTKDEARRIAVNVVRLPELLGKAD
jgi:hypothetical protein